MPNITISTGRLLQVLWFCTMKCRWRKVCGRPQLRSRHERSPNRTEVTMGSHFDQSQHAILFTAEYKTEMWRCNWSSSNDSGVHLALCSKHEYTVSHWKPKKSCDRNNTPRFVVIEITRPYPTPNDLPHLAIYRRSGLQWLETSPIKMSMNTQWQWFIFDQIQFRHAAMPVYWSLLLFPQIDCPRWLPHLVDSRSELQLSVTSSWCDHGYSANANLWALDATHSVLIGAIIWQETLA